MTKFLKNADVTGYISQTSVTSSLLKTDANGKLVAAVAGTDYQTPGSLANADKLIREVYNKTGATLTKGTVVYINDGQGNLPAVTKAIATGDSTSAQTFGVVQSDITNNNNGYVVIAGGLDNMNTNGLGVGTALYLSSTTAGAYTTTKQYAPAHLVYIGVVVRDHPTQGVIEVRIQNGYELDEIHNVAIATLANNHTLVWESATSLWKNKTIAAALGYTPADDAAVVKLTGNQTVAGVKTFSSVINASTLSLNGGVLAGNNIVSMRSNPTGGQFRIEKSDGSLSAYPFYIGSDGTALAYYYNASGVLKVLLHTDNTSYFGNSLSVGYSTYATTSYMLDINGTARFTGTLTISTSNSPGLDISKDASVDNRYLRLTNTQASSKSWDLINQTNANSNKFVIYNATDNLVALEATPAGAVTLPNGSITATSIIKSGGTSSQFLKADGSVDSSTYVSSSALSSYLALTGGTLTGDLTLSGTNPRLYFTDTDNNPDYFISNTDGTFTIYDVTNSVGRFKIYTTGNAEYSDNFTAKSFIKSGGTSAQFLKADGSVDSSTYLTSYTETDTLATVVSRGSTASTGTSYGVSITHTYSQTSLFHNTLFLKANNAGAELGSSIGFAVVTAGGDHHRAVIRATGTSGGAGGQFAIYTRRNSDNESIRGYYQDDVGNVRLDNYVGIAQDPTTDYRLAVNGASYFTGKLSVLYSGAIINLRTNSSGNNANLQFGNDSVTNGAGMALFGSAYVSNAQYRQAGAYIYSNQGGGLTLHAEGNTSMYLATNSVAAITINGSQAISLSGTLSGTSASFSGNLTVSSGNTTGNGIILADDGDIVDLNDGYCSMRFSYGVRIYSANRSGTPVITLANTGAITATGNISAANFSGSSSGTNTGDQTNISGYANELYSKDLRTIAPNSHNANRATFGFTSWANNSGAPYADYLHLRSYSDSSGGSDNLIMFLKSGIGMRIWQQTWNSGTAYSSYVDVLHSSNYSNYALPLGGGTMTGTPVFTATYGSGSSPDYTDIPNASYKVQVASGYWRAVYKSASTTISGVYNFETGKNVYWGEPTDTGGYYFRGRGLYSGGNLVLDAGNYSSYSLPLTGGTLSGNLLFADSGTGKRGIQGTCGTNDYWFVGGGATATNSGFLEIATGDDAQTAGTSEPIYASQYGPGDVLTGTLYRRAKLLDENGNTSFPGNLFATKTGGTNSTPGFQVRGGGGGPRIQTYGLDADSNAWMGLGTDMAGNPYEHSLYFSYGAGSYVNAGRLTIGSYDGSNYSMKATFLANGRIGFGIASPEAALHVAQPGQDDQLILGSAANNRDHAMFMYSGSNKAEVMRYQSGTRFILGGSGNISKTSIYGGGAERLTVESGGVTAYRIFSTSGGGYNLIGGSALVLGGSGATFDNSTGARLSESYGPVWNCGNGSTWHHQVINGSSLVGINAAGTNFGNGNIWASGDITAYYSDMRLKTKISNIKNALDKVLSLNGFYYTNNETAKEFGYKDDKVQVGVSAQEVEAILPEIVSLAAFDITGNEKGEMLSKSGENYKTVKYDKLVPLLIEAIKELKLKLDVLNSKK